MHEQKPLLSQDQWKGARATLPSRAEADADGDDGDGGDGEDEVHLAAQVVLLPHKPNPIPCKDIWNQRRSYPITCYNRTDSLAELLLPDMRPSNLAKPCLKSRKVVVARRLGTGDELQNALK